jgi:protein ImuB
MFVRLSFFRPTAAVDHWLELARMQFEQMALPAAVHRLAVHAFRTAPLAMRQAELAFCQTAPQDDPRQLAHLVNRLSNRLGREAVVRPQLCADAQPEQAYEGVPLAGQVESRRGAPRMSALPAPLHRPLLIHHPPRPLEVIAVMPDGPPIRCRAGELQFDVARCWGPERIETGWWRGPSVRRDYYRVESRTGTRFWLFRRLNDGRWFLQGEFG